MASSLSRRQTLLSASAGFGYLAFASLCVQSERPGGTAAWAAESRPGPMRGPHFPPSAKRVIFLSMQGGPSHVDTFDYKPQLTKDHGKRGQYGGTLLKSPWRFQQRGESGLWISDIFPELSQHADDLCLVRSMHCDQPVHPAAQTQMFTGTSQFIRPSLGAWTMYGLGTENASLPGFVSLGPPAGTTAHYGNGFLPAVNAGTPIGRGGFRGGLRGRSGQPVADLRNPRLTAGQQRRQLDFLQDLNEQKLRQDQAQSGVEGVIESYELAFRMQDALPELMDTASESRRTLDLYGAAGGPTAAFGQQCLLARRLIEAGVRFVQLSLGGWDQHANLERDHQARAQQCDRPIAGLLQDLKQRDLLRETLVIWGGEFGRTPAAQNGDGRDHNHRGYTTWMAGGGVKGGFSYGATDEHGHRAVDSPCHIHDWHATILHLLGLDHTRLTFRHGGRDFRLTDVHGNVATAILQSRPASV